MRRHQCRAELLRASAAVLVAGRLWALSGNHKVCLIPSGHVVPPRIGICVMANSDNSGDAATSDMAQRQTHEGASLHWERMWAGGLGKKQAFDCGGPSATLQGELSRRAHATRPGMRALVPGCGRGYDVLELAKHGFDSVVGLELAPSAVDAARAELRATADESSAARVSVQCGDFFEFEGTFDFIWDCTFLCALDPSVRERWAIKSSELLAPGGRLLTCVFPICEKVGGPPYALSVDIVRQLLEPVGLRAEEVRDQLGEDERHKPGGAPTNMGTALISWIK